ncbi:MAG: DUF975 family protein [Acidaminobacter sp.]|uniref:DUF975 family protein n=1 Tax=Acidaminobacter sp. TaxID=1872102 RepID=UPI001384AE47|nr:DUF975 family protein [Acidaminobacter sp.]MZQ97774.1 DUF975 family protein [Acidaminobacter sp.]
MSYDEMKLKAKEHLSGNWPVVIITVLIFLALTQLFTNQDRVVTLSNGESMLSPSSAFFNLLSFILTGPLTYGLMVFFRRLREQTADIKDLFVGFKRFGDTFLLNLLTTLFIALWSLLLIVPGIIAAIRYTMAYLIMTENPDMTTLESITASKMMMEGHKMEFFSFALSFIGWFLLGIATFGLGFLYVIPYYNASKVEFYENLKRGTVY